LCPRISSDDTLDVEGLGEEAEEFEDISRSEEEEKVHDFVVSR
jgi:hypothetical protein